MKIKSLLVVAVLVTAILGFAGFVGAQTTDNSTLIAQLMAQIAQLQAQLTQLMSQQQGSTAWCHTFNTYLVAGMGQGSQGGPSDEVSTLQTALIKEGFDLSGDDKGTFGDSTAAAVVAFQAKYSIRQTGTVGPMTRAKLNSLYGCSVQLPTPTPTPIVTCTPNWQCQWSQCQNGYQSQSVVDSNNCRIPLSNSTMYCPGAIQACNLVTGTINSSSLIQQIAPQSTGSNYGSITLNGTANNVSSVIVALVNTSYNGSYDYNTISQFLKGAGQYNAVSNTVSVSNGVWSVPFGGLSAGNYEVYVYSGDATQSVLAKGVGIFTAPATSPTVTFTAGNSNGQVFDTNTITTDVGATINFVYSSTNATSCYAYANSVLMNSIIDNGVATLTQGAVSGSFRAQSRFTGSTTYTVTCSNANGQQTSKSITLQTIQSLGTLIPSTTFENYNLVQGHSAQPTQITLTNASTSLINFTISVPNQPAWLNASYNTQPMSLQAGGVMGVGVSVDTTKVSGPGTYTTNLVFTGNFANSPITIPITLTVASQASLPVSVVSPNGGETLTVGQTYQIKWNAPSDPVSQNMQITLANSDTGELTQIGNSCIEQGVTAPVPSSDPNARYLQVNCSGLTAPVQNTGSYTWTVPTTLPSGSHYYIYVGELKIMGDGDFSNGAFSIVAPQ